MEDLLLYKIMVATAIYSVTMVLWKETEFPLCRAMESIGIIIIINIMMTMTMFMVLSS